MTDTSRAAARTSFFPRSPHWSAERIRFFSSNVRLNDQGQVEVTLRTATGVDRVITAKDGQWFSSIPHRPDDRNLSARAEYAASIEAKLTPNEVAEMIDAVMASRAYPKETDFHSTTEGLTAFDAAMAINVAKEVNDLADDSYSPAPGPSSALSSRLCTKLAEAKTTATLNDALMLERIDLLKNVASTIEAHNLTEPSQLENLAKENGLEFTEGSGRIFSMSFKDRGLIVEGSIADAKTYPDVSLVCIKGKTSDVKLFISSNRAQQPSDLNRATFVIRPKPGDFVKRWTGDHQRVDNSIVDWAVLEGKEPELRLSVRRCYFRTSIEPGVLTPNNVAERSGQSFPVFEILDDPYFSFSKAFFEAAKNVGDEIEARIQTQIQEPQQAPIDNGLRLTEYTHFSWPKMPDEQTVAEWSDALISSAKFLEEPFLLKHRGIEIIVNPEDSLESMMSKFALAVDTAQERMVDELAWNTRAADGPAIAPLFVKLGVVEMPPEGTPEADLANASLEAQAQLSALRKRLQDEVSF